MPESPGPATSRARLSPELSDFTVPPPMDPSPSPATAPARAIFELSHHKVLASVSRIAVLDLLRKRGEPLGVVQVAQHIGLHQNTVRSHLDLLVDSGYAIRRSEAPNGPGRPRVVYEATAAPDGDRNYRLLAEVLAQHLVTTSERPGEAAVSAGRHWAEGTSLRRAPGMGDSLAGNDGAGGDAAGEGGETGASSPISEEAAVVEIVRMLGDSGFAPELSADGTSIGLHRCPFRELAVLQPDVVCGAHLGIIQGALAELGTAVKATRLLPFVTPGLCVTTLARSAPSPRRSSKSG